MRKGHQQYQLFLLFLQTPLVVPLEYGAALVGSGPNSGSSGSTGTDINAFAQSVVSKLEKIQESENSENECESHSSASPKPSDVLSSGDPLNLEGQMHSTPKKRRTDDLSELESDSNNVELE